MIPKQALSGRAGEKQAIVTGLGWFSIALGVTELVAPRALAGWLGMSATAPVLRAYGVREIATGLGILASNDPTGWLWGRVGGDTLDLATLASGLEQDNPQKPNVAVAFAAVLAVTAIDVACATALSRRHGGLQARHNAAAEAYRRRSGFPATPERMRGAARDFKAPKDMRTPQLLRAYTTAAG
jgi:hypothetical protein